VVKREFAGRKALIFGDFSCRGSVQPPRLTSVFDSVLDCPQMALPIAASNACIFSWIGNDIRRPAKLAFSDKGSFGLLPLFARIPNLPKLVPALAILISCNDVKVFPSVYGRKVARNHPA